MNQKLRGVAVVSFESRRAREMARLIEKQGGECVSAPSMREVPLENQHDALSFGEALMKGEVEILVLLTGVGMQALLSTLLTVWPEPEILNRLSGIRLICRGPKPVAVLSKLGLRPSAVAPEPNTWQDLLNVIDQKTPISGKTVHLQEYGARNQELVDGLAQRGAKVVPVGVYRWQLPEDLAPLKRAIHALAERQVDACLFTSAQQVGHVLSVARESGEADRLLEALAHHTAVASIGPVTSDALRAAGIEPDIHPRHPKMGHLVLAVTADLESVLSRKRASNVPRAPV